MMKSAEDRSRSDLAGALDGKMDKCILADGEMRPNVIVMSGVGSEDSAQMGFAEDDDVVEAFPA